MQAESHEEALEHVLESGELPERTKRICKIIDKVSLLLLLLNCPEFRGTRKRELAVEVFEMLKEELE